MGPIGPEGPAGQDGATGATGPPGICPICPTGPYPPNSLQCADCGSFCGDDGDGRRRFVKDVTWDNVLCKLTVVYCDINTGETSGSATV